MKTTITLVALVLSLSACATAPDQVAAYEKVTTPAVAQADKASCDTSSKEAVLPHFNPKNISDKDVSITAVDARAQALMGKCLVARGYVSAK